MIALLLVALALGLSNFAAAIGIGISGVDSRTRWRVGVVFGLFEAGMPVLGLVLGRSAADEIGSAARWLGATLLIATGAYALWQSLRAAQEEADTPDGGQPMGRLLLTGLALSIDNLAVGFSLGTYDVNLVTAAAVIGGVSITMSLIGLELGARIGEKTGRRGELFGALVLIAVGIAVAAGAL
ncbi:manganese efflux pump MntP [Streptacidiphilus neutrinimicus]|uniref:manganese efflux pump MntP n=1 Tax=Streptacidiphilus neutrinimicus TaxID=105420 RepID=UPI0005AAD4BE|nr:manganese efflux pump MntP family protein [Streptacidiphilus neutrinimicus]